MNPPLGGVGPYNDMMESFTLFLGSSLLVVFSEDVLAVAVGVEVRLGTLDTISPNKSTRSELVVVEVAVGGAVRGADSKATCDYRVLRGPGVFDLAKVEIKFSVVSDRG